MLLVHISCAGGSGGVRVKRQNKGKKNRSGQYTDQMVTEDDHKVSIAHLTVVLKRARDRVVADQSMGTDQTGHRCTASA